MCNTRQLTRAHEHVHDVCVNHAYTDTTSQGSPTSNTALLQQTEHHQSTLSLHVLASSHCDNSIFQTTTAGVSGTCLACTGPSTSTSCVQPAAPGIPAHTIAPPPKTKMPPKPFPQLALSPEWYILTAATFLQLLNHKLSLTDIGPLSTLSSSQAASQAAAPPAASHTAGCFAPGRSCGAATPATCGSRALARSRQTPEPGTNPRCAS